jgi:hypothetical protein
LDTISSVDNDVWPDRFGTAGKPLDSLLLVRAASAVAEAARLCEGAVCGAASGGKSASGIPGGVAGVGLRTTIDDASSILALDDPSLASASGCAMGPEVKRSSRSKR